MKLRPVRRTISRGVSVSVLATVASLGAAAHADRPPGADRDKLGALLRTGADAARKKDFAACIEAYAGALRIEETAAALAELGSCEEAAGRNADAHRHLETALLAPGVDHAKEPWLRFGDAFARAGARVAQVYIAVDPPQASVIVDGRPVGKADGRRVAMEPGTHTIGARLDGYADAVETRSLVAGSTPSFHLVLVPKPRAAPGAVVTAKASAKHAAIEPVSKRSPDSAPSWYVPDSSVRGVLLTATYVGAATVLVSGATAIGLEIDRVSLHEGLPNNACHPAQPAPPPQCAPLHERTFQWSTAVNFTIGAAIATGLFGAATGAAIGLERSHFRPAIAPSIHSQGGGIVISGAW